MSNRSVEEALNVFDLRLMARKRLPKWPFEFVGNAHAPAAM